MEEKETINFARLIIIGKLMGYQEKEIWAMTLRKLMKLFHEYAPIVGIKIQNSNDDDIIPEDVS